MKVYDIIQPVLTHVEHDLLGKIDHIHTDPNIHTDPTLQRRITRLMRMGLVRMLHDADKVHYELTDKGNLVKKG